MNLLKDEGLFDSLKSVLVFAAAVGAEQGYREEVTDSAERIPLRIFNEGTDIPFMHALALAETDDVNMLREDNMEKVLLIFEERAAGGLDYLAGSVDQSNLKQSIERLVTRQSNASIIDDLEKIW